MKLLNQDEIQEVFFRAMLAGWANNVDVIQFADLPGSCGHQYIDGKFKVLDQFIVNPRSNKSSGTTIIWYDQIPVWVMHYGGWYQKRAIPFLKKCLCSAYESKTFRGGRGLGCVEGKKLTYFNLIEEASTFRCFKGKEGIFADAKCIGNHWYRGMTLIGNGA